MGRMRQRIERLEKEGGSFDANVAPAVTVGAYAGLPQSRRIVAGTGLSATDAGAGSTYTLALGNTAVTPGTYGDSTHVGQFTVDAQGRITAAANVATTGGGAITEGTYASLPGSPTNGDVYLVTDAPALLHRSGGAWQTFGPLWALTPVVSGSFAWDNQGGATDSALGPYRTLSAPASASSSMRVRYKSMGGATTLVALISGMPILGNFTGEFGIGWSDGTKYAVIIFTNNGGTLYAYSSTRATATSASSDYTSIPWNSNTPQWVKLVYGATNREIWLSADGYTWALLHSVARNDTLTPANWCYYANSRDASTAAAVTVLSWVES